VPAPDVKRRFLAAITEWLVTLPHDLKILYEAASDQDLDRQAREIAVGAIISTIAPGHLPGVPPGDFVNHCDGTIVVRMALHNVVAKGGEDFEAFQERFSEFFETLNDDIKLCEAALGDLFQWLSNKAARLQKLEYKGKKVAEYLDDLDASEFLYQEGLEFQTEYEVDEDVLNDRLKKSGTVLEALEKRRHADDRTTQ
jgi:hypothetical protein